ncbi:hypothetical protein K523DRAFT_257778, partial [Schizophyllum commune Tattone D]
ESQPNAIWHASPKLPRSTFALGRAHRRARGPTIGSFILPPTITSTFAVTCRHRSPRSPGISIPPLLSALPPPLKYAPGRPRLRVSACARAACLRIQRAPMGVTLARVRLASPRPSPP